MLLDGGVDGNCGGTVSTSTIRGYEAMPLIGGVPSYNTNQALRDRTANRNGGDSDVGLTKAF